jgi:two-component system nitrate/nitrite sensor histidine kinase NarX
MLLRRLRTSLVAQATLVLAVLFTLAVTRVVFVTAYNWMGQHDDEAIATASGLRSSIYLLTLRIAGGDTPHSRTAYIAALESQLNDTQLRYALERPGRDGVRVAWRRAHEEWVNSLRPALQQNDNRAFLGHVGHFVAELDRLDAGLQAEHKRLQVLDLKQIIVTMLLVISLQLLVFFTIRRKVARPLYALLDATDKFRAGNLGVRVPYESDDELGRLTHRFNTMADALADSHRRLEERVSEQVRELAQANAALELLFRSSHSLARGNTGGDALRELLQRFQSLLPGLQLSLHLEGGSEGLGAALCGTEFAPERCLKAGESVFLVRSQGQELGTLCACVIPGRQLGMAESELIQSLADLIGSAVQLNRQREQDNQLLLFNERNTIARELHDSLAQSLSFMKLQISRLQALIQQGKDCHAVEAVAEELRTGINEAYVQLRELLTTFRMDIGRAGVAELLQETAQEFSRRSGLEIRLQVTPPALALSGHERAQLVQVAREALTNAVRHADATRIDLRLREQGDDIELVVDDDGHGMQVSEDRLPHHGLAIMQERARSIGGTLQIESRQPRGTRVRLSFPSRRPPLAEASPS